MQVMEVETKTAFNGSTGPIYKTRSVQDDIRMHFSVLNELSDKIEELNKISTMPVLRAGSKKL